MTERSEYQKLRAHLAYLRMGAAAEALPGLLDEAIRTKCPTQAFSYGTACQAPRIACATADSGRGGPKARRTNRTEQSSGSPPG